MTSPLHNLTNIPFTILYIDNDKDISLKTVNFLTELTTKVVVSHNIKDAINRLHTVSVNLVVINLEIIKTDKMEILEEIRTLNCDLPIIFMTLTNDFETLKGCLSYGIQGCFQYPFELDSCKDFVLTLKKKHSEKYQLSTFLEKKNLNKFLVYGEHNLIDYIDSIHKSVIILVKIEEFKYLNFSLKSKISKKLQKRFAKKLFSHIPKECNFKSLYLLERGEFILIKPLKNDFLEQEFVDYVKKFQESVNSAKIKIGLVDYTLSIVCSLAYGENAYEKAQAGLRYLSVNKQNFILSNELHEEERVSAVKKLQTFKMLQTAINTYNIVSYFQPIVNNKTKKIEKYESLVRLIDSNKNIVLPYLFLDTAKEGKYYHEITSMVLRNSFRALFNTDMGISINLSTLDIDEERTREELFTLLERYKTEAHRITVELIEDEEAEDTKNTQEFIEAIKALGVKIAIDDFGKGFSNFERILKYKPDYIKIDGSLVKDIAKNGSLRNMVETIVYFSKKQGIETIAEYVENEDVYKILCEIGVDYSQGYYFGKAEELQRPSL